MAFPAQTATGDEYIRVICYCPTETVFSAAWILLHGPDPITVSDTDYKLVELQIFDSAGASVGGLSAQGATVLSAGATRITPVDAGLLNVLVLLTIPLTGANITVPANHSIVAYWQHVGGGAPLPALTIGLTPA